MRSRQSRQPGRLAVPPLVTGLTLALAAGIFYVGVYPRHLLEAAEEATKLVFA